MAQWFIKELSMLTGVSVKALHHYDSIGLLRPSGRTDANYRLYNVDDLQKLRSICALKFLGFSLVDIKRIITAHQNIYTFFLTQKNVLIDQIRNLQQACTALELILSDDALKNTDVNKIVAIIRMFMVKDQIKKWASTFLKNEKHVDVFTKKMVELDAQSDPAAGIAYGNAWETLIEEVDQAIKNGVKADSPKGIAYANRWMNLVNEVWQDNQEVKDALWQAYKEGAIPKKQNAFEMPDIKQEIITFIETAVKTGKLK